MKYFNLICVLFLCVLVTLLSGCGSSSGSNSSAGGAETPLEPGAFFVGAPLNLGSRVAADGVVPSAFEHPVGFDENILADSATAGSGADSDTSFAFDLGELKGSRDFFFIVRNVGDLPLTNVQITSADQNIAISPSTIDYLGPSGDIVIDPIIRVSATHGRSLNGVGFDSLMDGGVRDVTVNLSGESAGENVTATMALKLDVKVFSFVLSTGDDQEVVEMDKPTFASFVSNAQAVSFTGPAYRSSTPLWTLTNTGNVNLTYSFPGRDDGVFTTLAPGESSEAIERLPEELIGGNTTAIGVSVTAENVAFDESYYPVNGSGDIFFILHNKKFNFSPLPSTNN